jgi:hypothetical protein
MTNIVGELSAVSVVIKRSSGLAGINQEHLDLNVCLAKKYSASKSLPFTFLTLLPLPNLLPVW